MSCYFIGEESIYQLADYLNTLRKIGWDYFGYSMNSDLRNALAPDGVNVKGIYTMLAELNMSAVNSRYKDDNGIQTYQEFDVIEKRNIEPLYHPNDWNSETQCLVIKPWHYQLLKKLQCFIYQCSEDINRNNELLKGLEILASQITSFIVDNQPEYRAAQWG